MNYQKTCLLSSTSDLADYSTKMSFGKVTTEASSSSANLRLLLDEGLPNHQVREAGNQANLPLSIPGKYRITGANSTGENL